MSNQHCITVIKEHCGQVFFSKWSPAKGRRYLATGGAGDNIVDVWDYDTVLNQHKAQGISQEQPLMKLRHISVTKNDAEIPSRQNPNHFISSI